ncbi:EamA family transporter [Clostridium sp. JS66]|uniref:EamA family transporter n=1 Tax=Clostridium sp. JS66 TaxID=3064705 RepID=UPI00298E206B|nr:EamA family transporter [Clostridium sp. JS66]WPC42678.1 EamA family transporter [Clostridium sp. JS66]
MELNTKKEHRNAILAYSAVCIFWGSTYLAIRIGVGELPPTIFAGIRFIIAGVLMFGYAAFKGLPMPKNLSEILKISIVGIFLLVGGNGGVVWAETRVSSGIASLMVATVPLFMALIESLLPSKTKINGKGWIGLLIGFAGVAFLVLSDWHKAPVDIIGITLLIASALSWALGSVYSKGFTTSASTISNIAIQMLAGGFCLSLIGTFLGEFSKMHVTTKGLEALLYLVVFGSMVGYSCYIYILKKWPASKAGTYAYVNPPVAVILGAIFLGEVISLKIVIATIIILAGVILVQSSKTEAITKSIKSSGCTAEAAEISVEKVEEIKKIIAN